MVKANEIRIGNLFNEGKIVIESITETGVNFSAQYEGYNETVFSELKPILLTEEILLKAGFENKAMDYRFTILDGALAIDIDDNCVRVADSWEFGKVTTVHKLQNLFFALTGKDLEVNL